MRWRPLLFGAANLCLGVLERQKARNSSESVAGVKAFWAKFLDITKLSWGLNLWLLIYNLEGPRFGRLDLKNANRHLGDYSYEDTE